jgi:hypothetical protein
MARGRSRLEWDQTSKILAVLETCRQVSERYDFDKWMPEHLRPERVSAEKTVDAVAHKADIAAFNAMLRAGAGAR